MSSLTTTQNEASYPVPDKAFDAEFVKDLLSGEANDFVSSEGNPDSAVPFVRVIRGNMPVIVTAPHGGALNKEDGQDRMLDRVQTCGHHVAFRTKADSRTAALATEITRQTAKLGWAPCPRCGAQPPHDINPDSRASQSASPNAQEQGEATQQPPKPYLVVARFHRTKIDANRRPSQDAYHPGCSESRNVYNGYHRAIATALRECHHRFGRNAYLLLDVHGQSLGDYQDHCLIGTGNGKSVLSKEFLHSDGNFLWQLAHSDETHMKIYPDSPEAKEKQGYSGGATVMMHGMSARNGCQGIQLEFGKTLRGLNNVAPSKPVSANAEEAGNGNDSIQQPQVTEASVRMRTAFAVARALKGSGFATYRGCGCHVLMAAP